MFSFSQLKLPLILAPMAGGVNTPEMVSTVANLGGVGSFGFAYSTPDKIAEDLVTTKAKLNSGAGALNANFFVFSDVDMPDANIVDTAVENLVAAIDDEAVNISFPKPPYFHDLERQLEPVWKVRPEIITFHFGIPPADIFDKAHELGIAVGITATCAHEAEQIERAGADFVVAQGSEAGGHRGIFSVDQLDEQLPALDLCRVLSKVTSLPLVAAGGIMTAEHVRAAIDYGATAVQMGTAFLTTHESGASAAHKRYLLDDSDRQTRFTYGFSGRAARAISSRFIEQMEGKSVLPFPLQNIMTGTMRSTALKNDDGEYQSLWSGTNFRECRDESIESLLRRVFD